MGDQAPGNVDRVQRDILDPCYVGVAERRRVIDQRLDDQVVAARLAMAIVGEGIDPAGMGRAPCGFGELLDGAEGLAGAREDLRDC